jgi:PAS domain-containing protein
MELNKKPTYQDLEKQINELKSKKQLKHNEVLLESDKAHRDVLEASIDLICVVDKNGKILFVNHASNSLYGLSAKKCLGK